MSCQYDNENWVERSADPHDDLPPDVVWLLEKWILCSPWEQSWQYIDAIHAYSIDVLGSDQVDVPASLDRLASMLPDDDEGRVLYCNAIIDLVAELSGLLVDKEKLAGHLILQHDVEGEMLRSDLDQLTRHHQALHCSEEDGQQERGLG